MNDESEKVEKIEEEAGTEETVELSEKSEELRDEGLGGCCAAAELRVKGEELRDEEKPLPTSVRTGDTPVSQS